MLTYPPAAFMQTRHPASVHFAAAAVPGSASPYGHPAFPQFSTAAALTSPPLPTVAAFALQAQIPSPIRMSPPASAHRPEAVEDRVSPAPEMKKKANSVQQQQGGSKCSFSIESILSRGDKSVKNKGEPRSSRDQQAPKGSSLSPATPLSAGPKPNGFYYFYPSPTAQAFQFSPQSCLDSELHRSAAALHGRLSAPVAVISEIVRNAAGKLNTFITA